MHRKVAGESLHGVNAIKIAGSEIVAGVRYHTEDTLMYIAYYHVSKYLLFCFKAPTIAGRSRYEEIANLTEDEDGKEDATKTMENRMALVLY